MKYKYQNEDKLYVEEDKKILKFLYNNFTGRLLLLLICNKYFSKFVGFILNSKISKIIIRKYVNKYSIDLSKYESKEYKSFNDFFVRKLKYIPRETNENLFISTAESKIMVYNIDKRLILNIKNSKYSLEELLQDKDLAKEYKNGICIVYRLSPNNYHRFIFIDDGEQKNLKRINGKLHTVNPIVYDKYKVFTENTREISILNTKNFGKITQIEVGALCVGKITNNIVSKFKRYDEKGFFEFGGSTIIQLVKSDIVNINDNILENSQKNIETKINIGEIIGKRNVPS